MSRIAAAVVLCGTLTACAGADSPLGPSAMGSQSVTSTTPASSAMRVINVSGALSFGDVLIGASSERTLTIANRGTAPLTVSSLTVTGGLAAHITASWTSGTVSAGGAQSVVIRFAPTTAGAFNGTVVVNGDQNSGANAIAISGTAWPSFAGTWAGSNVISACNGTGSAQDLICGATRGAYKVGTALTFSLNLTQNGSTVSGTANIGGPSGPVTGTIVGNTLTLSGTLRDAQGFTSVVTSWSTTATAGVMSGSIGYGLTLSGMPGNALIAATLRNVNKR